MAAFSMACGGGGATAPDTTATATHAPPAAPAEKPAEPAAPRPPRRVMKSMTPTELAWTPLVPNVGDKGPMVASLWGNMESEPNGFFIKLPPGDKGSLHTHTSDYHGVAITALRAGQDGNVHALAQGTYWSEPAGTAYTNECPGKTPCIAFVHSNSAKVGVAPAKAIEKTLTAATWTSFAGSPNGEAWSSAWGDSQTEPSGMYVKIPAGNASFWHIHKFDYHAVVLAGTVNNIESGSEAKDLPVGSYYMEPGGYKHTTNCKADGPDCIIYVYVTGAFDMKPAE
jgi:quercetin dioxygenase-like cupin family protein